MEKKAINGTMKFQSNRPMFTKAATKDGVEYGVKLETVEIAGFHPFGEASPWTKGRGGTYQSVKVLLWLSAKLVPTDGGGREIPWGFSTEGPMALFIDPENSVWSFNFYPGGRGTTSFFADLKKHGFEATPMYRGVNSGGSLDDKSVLFAVSEFLTDAAFKQTVNLLEKVWRTMSPKIAGYKGNADGKDIYPIEIDHGYGEPLAGGTDVMRKLQNRLLVEQGSTPRPESPRLAKKLDRVWVVQDPGPNSELADIFFATSPNDLAATTIGIGIGDWKKDHTTLHDAESSAKADALARIKALSKKAGAEAALGHMAMEHATEEAKKKYLKEHPNAEPSNHVVQKDTGSSGTNPAKSFGKDYQRMTETAEKETGIRRRLTNGAPGATGDAKQFLTDAWNHVIKGVGKKQDTVLKKIDMSALDDEKKKKIEKAKKLLGEAKVEATKDFGNDPDRALYLGGLMMDKLDQVTGLIDDVFGKSGKKANWEPGSKDKNGWNEGKCIPDEISEGEGSQVPNILEKLAWLEGKFEEGVPADPKEDMSPEDKKKWDEMNEKNKDKFKEASDPLAEIERLASAPALAALEKMAAHRPLYEIAKEIRKDWTNPYFGAVPYLRAMGEMGQVEDGYGADSGASVIAYFLSNASKWKGEKAKEIKAELNKILKGSRRGSVNKVSAANTVTIVKDFLSQNWPRIKKAVEDKDWSAAVKEIEAVKHAYFYAIGLNEYVVDLVDTSRALETLSLLLAAIESKDEEHLAFRMQQAERADGMIDEWERIIRKYHWQEGLRGETIQSLAKGLFREAFKIGASVGKKTTDVFFAKGPEAAQAVIDQSKARKTARDDFVRNLANDRVVPVFRSWALSEPHPDGGVHLKDAVLEFVAADDEKEGKFEEGKPADPTENMTEEDAAKWRVQNLKNKDKFKEAKVSPRTRAGTKVQVKVNPMARAMYTYRLPAEGTVGVVTPIALPGGKGTFLNGPGGGLLYVKWPDGSHFGVSPNDLEPVSGKSATFDDPYDGFVADDDLVARYEEGVPADPTENMSPEDAKKWRDNTEEHKDEFKTAKQRIQFKKGDRLVVTPVPSGLAKSYPASKIKKEQTVTVLDDGFSDGLDVWDVETDDGNEDSIYGFQVKAKRKPKGKAASDVEARFEEGVPADPTVNMDPEDKAKWEDMNEEHGDKFKKAASVKKWDSKFIDAETAKFLGDKRFDYKPFHELSPADQRAAISRYPHKSVGAKYDFVDGHYYYPVDSKGNLTTARAQRVLAIPHKLILDDDYMAELGYKVSDKWQPGKKAFVKLALRAAWHELDNFKDVSKIARAAGLEAFPHPIEADDFTTWTLEGDDLEVQLTFAESGNTSVYVLPSADLTDIDEPLAEKENVRDRDAGQIAGEIKVLVAKAKGSPIFKHFQLERTASVPAGLYGHTKRVQADCETCVRKLSRVAAKLAKSAWRKDEQVAPFLAAHAKRAGSLPAAILVESMKGLGPKVASDENVTAAGAPPSGLDDEQERIWKAVWIIAVNDEKAFATHDARKAVAEAFVTYKWDAADALQDAYKKIEAKLVKTLEAHWAKSGKTAGSSRHGLYGFSFKTASLGLQVCTAVHEAAGHFAADLHARRAERRAEIADFLKRHAKEGKCVRSRLLLSCYPDDRLGKKASASVPKSVSGWLDTDV